MQGEKNRKESEGEKRTMATQQSEPRHHEQDL